MFKSGNQFAGLNRNFAAIIAQNAGWKLKRSKNGFLIWLVPGAMAVVLTGGFLLLLPAQDRNVRLEIPQPFTKAKQESAGRLELPTAPLTAPEARYTPSVPPTEGGMYKWTDAAGKVHYGDKPPEGSRAQVVDGSRLNLSVVTMPDVPAPQPRAQAVSSPAYSTQSAPAYIAPQNSMRCKRVKDEIAWIDARMRQGYKSATGEYLRAERRDLVKLRSQYCH